MVSPALYIRALRTDTRVNIDAWSLPMLIEDLAQLYAGGSDTAEKNAAPRFGDVVTRIVRERSEESARAFWTEMMQGCAPRITEARAADTTASKPAPSEGVLSRITDALRRAMGAKPQDVGMTSIHDGGPTSFVLVRAALPDAARLIRRVQGAGLGLPPILLAALGHVLSRGTEDAVIGVFTSARADALGVAGPTLNLLPLRIPAGVGGLFGAARGVQARLGAMAAHAQARWRDVADVECDVFVNVLWAQEQEAQRREMGILERWDVRYLSDYFASAPADNEGRLACRRTLWPRSGCRVRRRWTAWIIRGFPRRVARLAFWDDG